MWEVADGREFLTAKEDARDLTSNMIYVEHNFLRCLGMETDCA